jgi:hypothetical protein
MADTDNKRSRQEEKALLFAERYGSSEKMDNIHDLLFTRTNCDHYRQALLLLELLMKNVDKIEASDADPDSWFYTESLMPQIVSLRDSLRYACDKEAEVLNGEDNRHSHSTG